MRKPKSILLTKGQVIAQKMAEANLIVDHQSAKTPVAALIDSELDKKASGSADNTDAVHSSSREQTGELGFSDRLKLGEKIDAWMTVNGVKQNSQGTLCGLMALGYRVLESEAHSSQAPTDSAVQQEEEKDL